MSGKKKNKAGLLFLFIFILLIAIGAYIAYKIWGPNTGDMHEGTYLYIKTGYVYDDVLKELEEGGYVNDIYSFDLLAKEANYPDKVKAGRYKIQAGMSSYNMIRMLRSGNQEPVRVVLRKLRTRKDFAGFISIQLEPDSATIMQLLNNNEYLQKHNLDSNTALVPVIPDTYEFFWNTKAVDVYERLVHYYDKFWTEDKQQKAAAMNLTRAEVITLASIVEEETNKNDEKPTVASVYINRLRKGMKLQADPTIKFAVQDFTLRRVLNKHLQQESPYNTYMYAGLPPGPIATPSKPSINAVLNAPETDYIYFCAKADMSGYHAFASNYTEHMKNAREYQRELNKRGIR